MARHKKILLVDDDAPTRDVLARVLDGANYRVTFADGSEDALRLVQEHAFDLAFVGLGCDTANGWETVEGLTKSQPQLRFIVAGNGAERFEHPLAATAEALLEKPLDVELLLETLRGLSANPRGFSEKRNLWSLLLPMDAARSARPAN